MPIYLDRQKKYLTIRYEGSKRTQEKQNKSLSQYLFYYVHNFINIYFPCRNSTELASPFAGLCDLRYDPYLMIRLKPEADAGSVIISLTDLHILGLHIM